MVTENSTTKPTQPAVKKVVKKAAKKPAAKGKKAVKKTERKERAKKEGLRKPQIAVLKALKSGKPLTRKQISEKSGVDNASLSGYIGSFDAERRQKDDEKMMSLISLGFVKIEQHDDNGRDVIYHTITAKGKQALEKTE